MEETYEFDAICENCEECVTIEIPKGVFVEEVIHAEECPNCGCPMCGEVH